MIFLPKPGLKAIKQVHLHTKWRAVVLIHIKTKSALYISTKSSKWSSKIENQKKKKATRNDVDTNMNNSSSTNNNTNNTKNSTNMNTSTKKQPTRPKPKEHETCTITKNGVRQDADPNEIASDADDSDCVDKDFDSLVLLAAETEPLQQTPRVKTFLPPKPKAPTNKTEKLNRDKDATE